MIPMMQRETPGRGGAAGALEMTDYQRVEAALRRLASDFPSQPGLEEMAAAAGLSPFQFHRLFLRWAGVSPKRFLEFLTVEHAKRVLDESRSVLDAAYEAGLSGPGRLHDQFVAIDAVTPGEFKRAGEGLTIRHGEHAGPFGPIFLAMTGRGICRLAFLSGRDGGEEVADLAGTWPGAAIVEDREATAAWAERVFAPAARAAGPLTLFVKGTNFQINVWKALLRVPAGHLTTYGRLAAAAGSPGASRAVGSALAVNPVAFLIPCHRVIRGLGVIGDYRWRAERKRALIGWEAARRHAEPGR